MAWYLTNDDLIDWSNKEIFLMNLIIMHDYFLMESTNKTKMINEVKIYK